MPGNQMDLQGVREFSDRVRAGSALQLLHDHGGDSEGESATSGWFDRFLYRLRHPRDEERHPRSRARERLVRHASAAGRRPCRHVQSLQGDAEVPIDDTVGTVDLPSLWNQRMRKGMSLHWDGNNDSVEERNKSAAIGAGATPDSLDLPSMARIEEWILDLRPPSYPAARIDTRTRRDRCAASTSRRARAAMRPTARDRAR